MNKTVTVRSTRNPSVTRRMQLSLAKRYPKKWEVIDPESMDYPCLPIKAEPVPDYIKIVVAVIVHNRPNNIKEWVKCWKASVTDNAELVIIHNYRSDHDKKFYHKFLNNEGIRHIPRKNSGFDIGVFQDVCRRRLGGFPEYDYLLWCTDDIWPQRKTFIQEFYAGLKNGDVVCYEISKEVNPHIRTTGFMMSRRDVEQIQFNVDPILTKTQCYDFEHRDKVNSLMDQVKRFGNPVQVCDVECSPLWDTGHNSYEAKLRRGRRENEHKVNFP